MAIGVHKAVFQLVDEDDDPSTPRKRRIAEDGSIPNSSGNPTLEDYIVLEAASNYILSLVTESSVITISATDLNSA